MMQPRALLLTLLALFAGAAVVDATQLARARTALSPVTRVVELLKTLSKEIEKDEKNEEDLYETFVCWAKSMISQKTASNAGAQSRIDMLTQYVADLDAGRIELTTERVDLEKQIEGLKGDIEVADLTRQKEHADFVDAKEEMDKAIAALGDAIEVLQTATADHKTGVLLRVKGQEGEGFTQRSREAASLRKAVQLGEKVLTKGDAIFLSRLLTGEVPNPDWKKLNRKATFKMGYKARSFKIQSVLAKLLETFSGNLEDTIKAEQEAQTTFDKLMGSKTGELSSAQDALNELAGENGARGMSRADSTAEIDKLTAQVGNDKTYVQQVKDALADKKEEWKDRKQLRVGELAAISKAISILHNDDARDLFKKSFASQDQSKAAFFLQESATMTASQVRRQKSAVQELRDAARATADSRLSKIAARLAATGHFDEVIEAIDSMLELLKREETKDLETKETCESDRAADTRDAAKTSRTIDELTDKITRLTAEIADLAKEIEEKEASVAQIKTDLGEAKEMRDKENAEYLVAKKDDEDAAALVAEASRVLSTFYSENNLVLAQKANKGKGKQPFVSTAGEAPPPPPTTWEAPYGGRTSESTGIVAVLTMIHEDITKDISKATDEEEAALNLYTKTTGAMKTEMGELNSQITAANQTKGEKESDVVDTKGDKRTKKGELEVIMKKLEDASTGCEFFTTNYPLRLKNRQVEIDGLEKAKAILQGAAFAKPADPNREMKPGDALLQAPQRALRRARN